MFMTQKDYSLTHGMQLLISDFMLVFPFLSYLNYGYVFLFPAVSTAVEWIIYALYVQETPP